MSKLRKFSFVLFLFCFGMSLISLSSCNKDDGIIDGGGTTTDPFDSTKAYISFETYWLALDSGTIGNALVGIGTSESAVNSGIYLKSGFSSASGKISFDKLAPGIYYYRASKTVNTTIYTAGSSVTLEAGDDITRKMILRE